MTQTDNQADTPSDEPLNLELLIDRERIEERIKDVAEAIEKNYRDEELTIVMIMKGALLLVADLVRHLSMRNEIEFIQCKSYDGFHRGEVTVMGHDKVDCKDKNILIVDDIFDSGATLKTAHAKLQEQGPKTLKTLVLLEKNIKRETSFTPDYTLFTIEDHFVVGYGLDYKEYYRGLREIYKVV